LKAIEAKADFTGLAAAAEIEVEDRLAMGGIEGELARDAKRLQVVSDLYYDAFTKAMQDQAHDKATGYLKVWAWVTNSAVRAWETAKKHKKQDDGQEAATIINTYRSDAQTSNTTLPVSEVNDASNS
jgi:hypothetical protein